MLALSLSFLLMATGPAACAAELTPGTLDTSFQMKNNGEIHDVGFQSDGKILVVGEFTVLNDMIVSHVARLHFDGTTDQTFRLGSPLQYDTGDGNQRKGPYAAAVAVQPDGKILIGGRFTRFGEINRRNLIRLHPDGSLDPTLNLTNELWFAMTKYDVDSIHEIALRDDGKIYVAFDSLIDGKKLFALLNADGTVADASPPLETNPFQERQSDGRIIIYETTYPPKPNPFRRINADGTIDPTFRPPVEEFPPTIFAVAPNDKILIHSPLTQLKRLAEDGGLDLSFKPFNLGGLTFIKKIRFQQDGKIMVILPDGGTLQPRLLRLFGDPVSEPPKIVYPLTNQVSYAGQTPELEVHVSSATLPRYQWQIHGKDIPGATNRILRLPNVQSIQSGDYRVLVRNEHGSATSNNALLTIYDLPAGAPDPTFRGVNDLDGTIDSMTLLPDGKILVGGTFRTIGGTPRSGIARLNRDGTLDPAFDPGTGISGRDRMNLLQIAAIAVQPDGRIIVGGHFKLFNGVPRPSIARLNADGSLDQSFNPDAGTNRFIRSIAVQPDGRILVGGTFQYTADPENFLHLVRLNTDGFLDRLYHPDPLDKGCGRVNCWDYLTINTIAIQPDGKALIAGRFTKTETENFGDGRGSLALLDHLGRIDPSFRANIVIYQPGDLNTRYSPIVITFAAQPDGKLLVAGYFSTPKAPWSVFFQMDRLLAAPPHGSDTNFVGTLSDGNIHAVVVQPDGKIVIGGAFKQVNKVLRRNLARLNPDGTVDPMFDPLSGPDGPINIVKVDSDSSILVAGHFRKMNGISLPGIARLAATPSRSTRIAVPSPSQDGLSLSWLTEQNRRYILESTENLSSPQWTELLQTNGSGGIQHFLERSQTPGQKFYRMRVE